VPETSEQHWRRLETAWREVEYVQGIILDQVEGGFTVDLGGMVALLPTSQVDTLSSPDVTRLKNAPQTFQIMKMDRQRASLCHAALRLRRNRAGFIYSGDHTAAADFFYATCAEEVLTSFR